MQKNLTVLVADDSRERTDVLVGALRQGGFKAAVEQVDTVAAMERALSAPQWDLVMAHVDLPGLDILGVLERVKAGRRAPPFIVVTETLREDEVVALIKAGADDYVAINNLSRLVPAVERELKRREEVRARPRPPEEEAGLPVVGRDDVRQRSEEQFRSVFELSPMGMAIHGSDGRYLNTNAAYQRMLGYSHEELQRLGVRRLTYPPDVAQGQGYFQELLEGRRDHYQRDKRYIRRDGSVVWAQSTSVGVRRSDGQLAFVISMVEDFTERRELAGEILSVREREQQRLGQDLHDGLCQNLIGIKFKSSLLEKKLQEISRDEASDARAIARALENAVQLAYDMARGLQPVLLAREGLICALEELASSTQSLFNVACRFRSRGTVDFHNPPMVTHLYRIAQECVSNAIKHGRGTRLSIVLAVRPADLLLWVSDNGIGFGTRPGGSRGLGLGIMQHRAKMIDASLSIQARIGGGTRVVCSLARPATNAPTSEAIP